MKTDGLEPAEGNENGSNQYAFGVMRLAAPVSFMNT